MINKSALSAMQDFLRSREASSTTEGVLAKVDLNLCYKKPCVIKKPLQAKEMLAGVGAGVGAGVEGRMLLYVGITGHMHIILKRSS